MNAGMSHGMGLVEFTTLVLVGMTDCGHGLLFRPDVASFKHPYFVLK